MPPKNEGLACFQLLPSLLLGMSPWLPARQTVQLAYGQEYNETCRVLTCGTDGLKKFYAFFGINSINIISMHMLRSLKYYSYTTYNGQSLTLSVELDPRQLAT